MRMLSIAATVAASLLVVSPARAHLYEGEFPLTVAEANPPTTPPAAAGGTATIEVSDTLTIEYDITVHDLTGVITMAHIHEAPAGSANPPLINLDITGDTTVQGETRALTQAELATLLAEGFYVNIHTSANGDGEVRGQIKVEPVKGTCSCRDLSKKDFRKCVKNAIKGLEKSQKKSAEVKQLKKAVKKSACGLPEAPAKKPLACCLPENDVAEIVTDKLCAPVKKEAQCTALGGTIQAGADCVPNPCVPPASPSGAFLD